MKIYIFVKRSGGDDRGPSRNVYFHRANVSIKSAWLLVAGGNSSGQKKPRLNRNMSLTLFEERQGSIVMDRWCAGDRAMYESTLLPGAEEPNEPLSIRPWGIKSSMKAAVHLLHSYAKVVKTLDLLLGGRRGKISRTNNILASRKIVVNLRLLRGRGALRLFLDSTPSSIIFRDPLGLLFAKFWMKTTHDTCYSWIQIPLTLWILTTSTVDSKNCEIK